MNSRIIIAAALLGLAPIACREADQPVGLADAGRFEVSSDPLGAAIWLDGVYTGKATPNFLRGVSTEGEHEILVRMDRDGVTYGYRVSGVQAKTDSLITITGPLTVRCSSEACMVSSARYHTLGTLRIATQANGSLFSYNYQTAGLYYPNNSANSYVAIGMPMIAMTSGARDTLALGIYDAGYLAGRPAPDVTQNAERYAVKQTTWIVPPSTVISTFAPTVRGIEVREELIGMNATSGVAFLKLTFENITHTATYHAVDPILPVGGLTFNNVYVGFALDADIGDAMDDMITYDPSLNMVYAYDMDFADAALSQSWSSRPALIGLRMLDAPADGVAVLNAWRSDNDWHSGETSAVFGEKTGFGVLSGTRSITGNGGAANRTHAHSCRRLSYLGERGSDLAGTGQEREHRGGHYHGRARTGYVHVGSERRSGQSHCDGSGHCACSGGPAGKSENARNTAIDEGLRSFVTACASSTLRGALRLPFRDARDPSCGS